MERSERDVVLTPKTNLIQYACREFLKHRVRCLLSVMDDQLECSTLRLKREFSTRFPTSATCALSLAHGVGGFRNRQLTFPDLACQFSLHGCRWQFREFVGRPSWKATCLDFGNQVIRKP